MNDYLAGIELFNNGRYWHAHEHWETCWREAQEPDATFFKGIIQAAAALVHWQRGNERGLRLNWAKARSRLCVLPAIMHYLEVDVFVVAMDSFVSATSRQAPPVLTLVQV